MAESCDINDKKTDIACIVNCFSGSQVEAMKLYLLVQTLIALDPTYAAYTLTDWKNLVKAWQGLSLSELQAIDLVLTNSAAVDAGVSVPATYDLLGQAAKCYQCIPGDTLRNITRAIECLILAASER